MENDTEQPLGLPIWEDPDLDFNREGREEFFKDSDIAEEKLNKYIEEARRIPDGNPYLQEIEDPIGGIGNVD